MTKLNNRLRLLLLLLVRFHMNDTGSLIVLDVQYSDIGEYKAVADNGAGSIEASASLNILHRKLSTVYCMKVWETK